MVSRRITLALALCTAMFLGTGWAQSAGGLVSATTSVRYTPVAFPQLVQLVDFNTVALSLSGSDANGDTLTFALVSGPSLGSVGALDASAGTITYAPPAGFSTSDSFTFLVTDGVLSSEAVAVTIFAPRPAASLSAASLDLGSQIAGVKSPAKMVTIHNTSVAPLSISTIAINGPNAADFAIENTGTCPGNGTLVAGTSCTLAISFIPAAAGVRMATVAVTDNAFDSPQTVALTGIGTDFSFGPANGGSTSATITAGQAATYNLQIDSANGFVGQISLSCAGAPQRATCSVSPSQVNVTGAATAFSVNVTTAAPTTAQVLVPPGSGTPPYLAGILIALALICLLGVGSNGKRVRFALCSVGALGLALFTIGCGSGNNPPSPSGQPGTPAGTYTLIVTGAAGGATRSTPLTLVVH